MDQEAHLLEVAADEREAFVLCLVLGTFEAMRRGSWPLEAGVWTLGRPAFREPLASGGIDPQVIAELEGVDELETLARLCGRVAAEARLDRMITVIHARLAAPGERSWYARWLERPAT